MSQSQSSGQPRRKSGGAQTTLDSMLGRANPNRKQAPHARRKEIAETTIDAIKAGQYVAGENFAISDAVAASCEGTKYYEPDSELKNWRTATPSRQYDSTQMSLFEITTLQSALLLWNQRQELGVEKIGVLNFASAKHEGGGFLTGAQAQEESIARASTIYPSLMTDEAQQFYRLHRKYCTGKNRDGPYSGGFYSHAMIFSPDILVIRGDDQEAKWHPPIPIDVITSPAVNNGVVMRETTEETVAEAAEKVGEVMFERMARILFLMEQRNIDSIVLGSFGTGVFKNDVGMVARIWTQLLGPGSRFEKSFKNVVFGVIGHETFLTFKRVVGPLTVRR